MRHKKSQKKSRLILTRSLISLFLLCIIGYYFLLYYQKHAEPEPSFSGTDSHAVYSLKSRMKLLSLSPLIKNSAFKGRAAEIDYGTYVIPGLNNTLSQVYEEKNTCDICTSMVPQGLAVTEDYLLVSAYCYSGTHNSVIYVIDKNTHEFIKELVLKNKSHVGGLAYDSVHHTIWIAGMSHGIPQVNGISLKQLEEYSFTDEYLPIHYSQSYDLYAITRSSFLTYHDNALYVGYFTKNSSSVLEEYTILEDGTLKTQAPSKPFHGQELSAPIPLPVDTKVIQERAQGVAFYKNKLLFSHSYGVLPSFIHVYDDTFKKLLEETDTIKSIPFPEKMEQIYVDGNDLYVLFESAAYGYRAKSFVKMDRILKLNLDTLLS